MKVLVVGASGGVARNVVSLLAERGHEPVAVVRKQEQEEQLRQLGASDVVIADLEEDISHIFTDQDAVIFAAGSGGKTGGDKTILVDMWGAMKVIDGAVVNGIERFIMLSSIGTVNPDKSERIRHYLVAKKNSGRLFKAIKAQLYDRAPGHVDE